MTQTNVRVQMQIRRDTAASWSSANPTPLAGELCYETDTGKIKVGTGSSAWIVLPYSFLPLSGGSLTDNLTIHNKKELRLSDATAGTAGDHYSAFKAGTQSANLTYTLPTALPASSGQVLACTDAGVMSWASDSTNDSSKMPLAGGTFVGDVIFDGETAGRDITYDRSANNLIFNDNSNAIFGTSSDGLKIYQSGSHSYIDNNKGSLIIRTNVASDVGGDIFIKPHDDEDGISVVHDAGVSLYYAGAGPKLATTSDGVSFNDGNITNVGSIALDSIKGDADDNTNITFATNDVITFKCGTTSPALTVNTTQVKIEDDQKFVAGTGNNLEIFFDGSNSYIKHASASTGFIIESANNTFIKHGGELCAKFGMDSGVKLYYDAGTYSDPKFETTSTGVSVTGNLKIGSAGNGILFAPHDVTATNPGSDSNLLSDYEEGTYEPTLTCQTTGVYTASSHTIISYVKIGNLCHIEGYLNVSAITGTANGNLRISLPFTSANKPQYDTATIGVSMRGHGDTLPGQIGATDQGVAFMEILSLADNGNAEWVKGESINHTWNIRIGGSYRTAG